MLAHWSTPPSPTTIVNPTPVLSGKKKEGRAGREREGGWDYFFRLLPSFVGGFRSGQLQGLGVGCQALGGLLLARGAMEGALGGAASRAPGLDPPLASDQLGSYTSSPLRAGGAGPF